MNRATATARGRAGRCRRQAQRHGSMGWAAPPGEEPGDRPAADTHRDSSGRRRAHFRWPASEPAGSRPPPTRCAHTTNGAHRTIAAAAAAARRLHSARRAQTITATSGRALTGRIAARARPSPSNKGVRRRSLAQKASEQPRSARQLNT